MVGKHLDKVCEDCENTPVIPGRRWADHRKLVHSKQLDVKFKL